MSKIVAPFTAEQVDTLNSWQRWGKTHPFTCPTHSTEPLTAAADGWHCQIEGCGYAQDWAHDFMAATHFCTKEHPYVAANADPSEYWIHVDAKERMPDWDGEIIPFHCPNCGLDFDVDCR